ncbi:hypothetical protein ACWGMA_08510 [Streptomyces asiaticus]
MLLSPEREAEIRKGVVEERSGSAEVRDVLAELDHIRGRVEAADEYYRRATEAEAKQGRLQRLFIDLEIRAGKAERERDELTRLLGERDAALNEAARVSAAQYRRLRDEQLAGSALYAAMTQPTTPEQRQAALDQFRTVAQQVTTTEAGDR